MANRAHWYYDHPPACTCVECQRDRLGGAPPAGGGRGRMWALILVVALGWGVWLARDNVATIISGLQPSSQDPARSYLYPPLRSSCCLAGGGSHSYADLHLGFAIHYETREGSPVDRRRSTGGRDSGAHQSGAIGGRSREAGSGAEPGLSGD